MTATLPEFPFEEYRAKKINKINKFLEESTPLNQNPTILGEAMRYTLLPGTKRLPPSICIASCEAVGGHESLVLPTACALEMILAMEIIQDDLPCFDNDHLRRGMPSNHKAFGEATSILASNSLLFLAIETIASDTENISSDRIIRAIKEICYAYGFRGVAAGQIWEMKSEGKEVNSFQAIQELKGGKFLEAPAVCGAIIGGGNEVQIEKLRNYGKLVGMWLKFVMMLKMRLDLLRKRGREEVEMPCVIRQPL